VEYAPRVDWDASVDVGIDAEVVEVGMVDGGAGWGGSLSPSVAFWFAAECRGLM
jgi:hypothetical protein